MQAYSSTPGPSVVVHPDGTIFTVDGDKIVGIDPKTGQTKFSVALEHSIDKFVMKLPCTGTDPGDGIGASFAASAPDDTTQVNDVPPTISNLIIAGDGYAYAAYHFQTSSGHYDQCGPQSYFLHQETDLKLARIDSSGNASKIPVKSWTYDNVGGNISGEVPSNIATADLITNADQGVLLSWTSSSLSGKQSRLTTTSNGSVSESTLNLPNITPPGDGTIAIPVQPVLQQSDGTFIGVTNQGTIDGDYQSVMVAFDWHGNVKWTFPGAYPAMATSDGGVIAWLWDGGTVSVDSNGKTVGQVTYPPIYSWKAAYRYGSTDAFDENPDIASSYASAPGGNLTGNGFSLAQHSFGIVFCGSDPNGGDGRVGLCQPGDDVQFVYQPGIDRSNYASAINFSAAYPGWVKLIKDTALNTLTAAFSNFPVIVKRHTPQMRYGGEDYPQFDHTLFVAHYWAESGDICPFAGLTKTNERSYGFYFSYLCGAEVVDGFKSNPTYTPRGLDKDPVFLELVRRIGRGIGNNAAHEFGHQLTFSVYPAEFKMQDMDCTQCSGRLFEIHRMSDWYFTDTAPTIHWTPRDTCAWSRYLLNNKTQPCTD